MMSNRSVKTPVSPLSTVRIALLGPFICLMLLGLYIAGTHVVSGQQEPVLDTHSKVESTSATSARVSIQHNETSITTQESVTASSQINENTSMNEAGTHVWVNGEEVQLLENAPEDQTIPTPSGTVHIESSGTSESESRTVMRVNISSEADNEEEVRIKSRIRIED